MPGLPQVGVFDTAFHQTMPDYAYMYALPYHLYKEYGVRRYGFHRTSHRYVSQRVCEFLGVKPEGKKIITCHIGNGASIAAVKDGKCVDTSMGLTPLEGLIMGTRSGDIDPSVVEFIMKKEGCDVAGAENLLNKKSGVYGLSGDVSSDFRDLEDGYNNGDEGCIRAINTFCYRVSKYIGAYAAAMDGVDCICFTAGVGENGPLVRSIICEKLGFLGVKLDKEANEVHGKDKEVSTPDSKVKVLVVPTNEELAIARDTNELCK
jgi:acetate kinase